MLFLDPEKPLSTCIEKSCIKCDVRQDLNCHFNLTQLLKFIAVGLPAFIIAGTGIYFFYPLLLIPWILLIVSYFGFIEIRVMCSHCPHYAEPDISTLKCWANYGCPKLWKYRPGPMSIGEKAIFFSGLALIIVYPYPCLILLKNVILLILYSIAVLTGFFLLNRYLCTICINFACPLNRVDRITREKFFKHNPQIGNAWEK